MPICRETCLFLSRRFFRSGTFLTRQFRDDLSGGVAIPIGLTIIMLSSAVGMTVDYSRAVKAQQNLQDVVDAAALAAAASVDQQRAEQIANTLLEGGLENNNITVISKSLTNQGDQQNFSVEAEVPTMMTQLIGMDSLSISASATASRGLGSAEVVVALDTTGSMGFGSSWGQATDAMAGFLVDLDALAINDEEFLATFFPYGDRVNIGRTRAEDWAVGPIPTDDEWGKYTTNTGDIVHTNKGCVEPREELVDGNPHALTDTPATTLGFVPTAEGNYQSYLPERGGFTCPEQEIIGPTKDISSFVDAIQDVDLSGTGRFDVGMAWAHRMLSPKWQGLWGVPGYPSASDERQKIAILITDMHTNAFHYEVPYQISNTANTPNFGHNNGTQMGFDNFVEVCDRMKADDITIHTVYVNGNTHGVPFIKACATSTAHYHEVTDVSDLRQSLSSIAGSLLGIRLVN